MIKVYRIEYKNGFGLWSADDKYGDTALKKHPEFWSISRSFNRLKATWEDTFLHSIDQRKVSNEWIADNLPRLRHAFGFKEDVTKYFPNEIVFRKLLKMGFFVYEYKVKHCWRGEHQIIFEVSNVISKKNITNQFVYVKKS